jgi:hypothetical protein
MVEQERTLRSLYALREASAEAHLGEDDWLALASGEGPASHRERAIDHVVRCGSCTRVYRGLADLEEGARQFDKRAPQVLGPAPLDALTAARWVWWGGLAAAATLVWAIAQPRPALAPAPQPDASELRGPARTRPVLLEPLGAVARWPERLHWEPIAQARGYRVAILDGEGNALWASAVVAQTAIAWPVQVPPRAGRVYWQVTAYPQGATDAEGVASVLASFDYQP